MSDRPNTTTATPQKWIVRVGPIGARGRPLWLDKDGKLSAPVSRARWYFNPLAAEQAAITARLASYVVEAVSK